MKRHKRWTKPAEPKRAPSMYTCQKCLKLAYPNRSIAKSTAKAVHPDGGLRPYQCPHYPSTWHLGHVPPDLRHGIIDRDDYRESLARRDGWAT